MIGPDWPQSGVRFAVWMPPSVGFPPSPVTIETSGLANRFGDGAKVPSGAAEILFGRVAVGHSVFAFSPRNLTRRSRKEFLPLVVRASGDS